MTSFYPPYSAGGDAIAVQRLARELVRQGHSVTVIHDIDAFATMNRDPLPAEIGPPDNVRVFALHSKWGIASPLVVQQTGRPLLQRRRLSNLLNDGGFDVVNFHNASLIGGPGLFRFGGDALRIYTAHEHWLVCPTHILWKNKEEVCQTPHCLSCQLRYHRPPQFWRYTHLMRDSLSSIDAFVAMSEFSRDKHREFGFTREMHVIPPCGGTASRPALGASPHARPYFFFAGRLEGAKGLQTVLPMLRQFPQVDLLVAGEGSLKEQLQRDGGPQVVFLDQLPPGALDTYYSHAVATVVPSLAYETFGLTLAESFRCGTPVIARRIGPFPEIVSRAQGGILYQTDDELLSAMRRLSDDPAYRSMLGEQGRSAFVRLWEDSVSVRQYLEMVSRSMRSKPRRAQET